MDPREAWQLLSQHSVGRVAFTDRALPAISAVTYTLVGTSIAMHCPLEGLSRQLDGQVVAFEIDHLDPVSRSGWSVVLTGRARLLLDDGDTVVIDPRVITGRHQA